VKFGTKDLHGPAPNLALIGEGDVYGRHRYFKIDQVVSKSINFEVSGATDVTWLTDPGEV